MIIDLKSHDCSQESQLFLNRLVRFCFNHTFICPLLSELVASYMLAEGREGVQTRNVDPLAGHAAAGGEAEGEVGGKDEKGGSGNTQLDRVGQELGEPGTPSRQLGSVPISPAGAPGGGRGPSEWGPSSVHAEVLWPQASGHQKPPSPHGGHLDGLQG